MPDVLALIEPLTAGLPAHGEEDDAGQAERRLLGHLLLYHWREGKPAWWRYFDLRGKPLSDLLDDRDALAGARARPEPSAGAPSRGRSTTRFTFPAQEFRLELGDAEDPTTGERFNVVDVEDDHVVLRRGSSQATARARRAGRRRRRSRSRCFARGARWRSPSRCSPATAGSAPPARLLRRDPPGSPRARSARTSTRWSPRRSVSITPSFRSRGRRAPARPSAAPG